MKTAKNNKVMEDFISYKLDNAFESESSSRAFNLQKKYQKILDQSM